VAHRLEEEDKTKIFLRQLQDEEDTRAARDFLQNMSNARDEKFEKQEEEDEKLAKSLSHIWNQEEQDKRDREARERHMEEDKKLALALHDAERKQKEKEEADRRIAEDKRLAEALQEIENQAQVPVVRPPRNNDYGVLARLFDEENVNSFSNLPPQYNFIAANYFSNYHERIQSMFSAANLDVHNVEFAPINRVVVNKFSHKWRELAQVNNRTAPAMCFHGTNTRNYPGIMERGLLVPGQGQNPIAVAHGSAYGVGIYLGMSPATSLSYVAGEQKMLVCAVLLGSRFVTSPDNNIVVVFNSAQVVPCFIVTFARRAARPVPLGVFLNNGNHNHPNNNNNNSNRGRGKNKRASWFKN